jgi:hypothetical protein
MTEWERAAQYRERARQLRRVVATEDLRRETRQAMLELANNYERLADLLEQMP